ncbi:MAG: hypothetical protein RPU34_03615 [Candidatus Sedimenticola sp. (ex Thyasira tokunagai)]
MGNYTLEDDLFVQPTPAGAFYAVSGPKQEPARRVLFHLMRDDETPALNLVNLQHWSGIDDEEEVLQLLYRIQELGWISGEETRIKGPEGSIEEVLARVLPDLADEGKVLLADNLGFYLSSHGYPHEAAEELSALSADLGSLYDRHEGLLKNNLGQSLQSWGLMDAAGNSQLGFWPLFFGGQRFVLALNGRPRFNQPAFRDMVWALARRYVTEDMFKE